jgi:hypothetical protein
MKNNLKEQYETSQREIDDNLFKRVPVSFFSNDIWISSDPFDRRAAFIDLYSLAFDSYKNNSESIPINETFTRVYSGQVARGLRSLGIRWNWSTKKVSNFLKKLEELGYIEVVNTRPVTIIELKDYVHRKHPKKNTKETRKKRERVTRETVGA